MGRSIPIGTRELSWGDEVTELRDCNDLVDDREALVRRLEEDGYLLVRGLYPRSAVLDARRIVCDELAGEGQLAADTDPMDAVTARDAGSAFWGGRKGVTHHPDVKALFEHDRVFAFFSQLFGEAAMTYDYKWLRAVAPGGTTGSHYDVVYMGRGTRDRLMTVWSPLGDVPIELGPLALCVGSHREAGFERLRETYGKMDVDRDRVSGWFSDDPVEVTDKFGGQWQTTAFEAGDALIFGMFTMHGSVKNTTDRFRISSDTRFQPAADPVDERWVGDNPIAHYAWHKDPDKVVPMEEAREEWGV